VIIAVVLLIVFARRACSPVQGPGRLDVRAAQRRAWVIAAA